MFVLAELTSKIISLLLSILIVKSFYLGNVYLSNTFFKESRLGSRCNKINFSLIFVSVTITEGTPILGKFSVVLSSSPE